MKTRKGKAALAALLTLFFCGALLVSVPSATFGKEKVPAARNKPAGDYQLGAGDLIQVVVWKNEEVSGEFRVRPDGKFSMPLIGDILAQGNTTDGTSMQIEQKLKLFIEAPYVSIIVVEAASNRIYILGEVTNPGTYAIDGSLTALQALALAGGFTEFASREKMVLVRGVGESQRNIPLSYTKMLREPDVKFNPVLERGDTLVVP
ncbi:MAG: polysaccharide biosynthesis/export family protein [bacterium]|nr:polysaccharide biosynthesis/export family protein [bacterium]MDT8366124.1 polysaccharide biosynthesis/export family protein [bacterium]